MQILFLGESDSRISTMVQHFQRFLTPKAFENERTLWKPVVQLNAICSVLSVLGFLSANPELSAIFFDSDESDILDNSSPARKSLSACADDGDQQLENTNTPGRQRDSSTGGTSREQDLLQVQKVRKFEDLAQRLVASLVGPCRCYKSTETVSPLHRHSRLPNLESRLEEEWTGAPLAKARVDLCANSSDRAGDNDREAIEEELRLLLRDFGQLWNREDVQAAMRQLKGPGSDMEYEPYFLDSIERIAERDYVPSEDDVFRANFRSSCAREYMFRPEGYLDNDKPWAAIHPWKIATIEHSHTHKAVWAPYFHDVDVVVYLASMSGFDERGVTDDPAVTRMEHSMLTWKAICAQKMVTLRADMFLFLTKCDTLRAKLNSGTRFAEYDTGYGERPNTYEAVSEYLQAEFQAVLSESTGPSGLQKKLHCFEIQDESDPESTHSVILSCVQRIMGEKYRRSLTVCCIEG